MMRCRIAALILLLSVATTVAGQTIDIGGVEVPADCPMVRGEHPRLLFQKKDLPAIRERLKHPRMQEELAWARSIADKGGGKILLGVLWQLTGEQKYADLGRKAVLNSKSGSRWFPHHVFAVDLLMDAMSDEERKEVLARQYEELQKTSGSSWQWPIIQALLLWGHGYDEFIAPRFQQMLSRNVENELKKLNEWSRGRGGARRSRAYAGETCYGKQFGAIIAASNALGTNYVGQADFAAHTPSHYVHHYVPWTKNLTMVKHGPTAEAGDHWWAVTPFSMVGDSLAVLAAARFHDGLGQWWIDEVLSKVCMGWPGQKLEGFGSVWGKLLWYDVNLEAVPASECPPVRYFPEGGSFVMRSDWTKEATFALFKCGRFSEVGASMVWGGDMAENLHFIIGKKGLLTTGTGGGLYSTWPHANNYMKQSIAYNTVTVGREPYILEGASAKKAVWVTPTHCASGGGFVGVIQRGGQSRIYQKDWWQAWGIQPEVTGHHPRVDGQPFKPGRMTALETSPYFDYACGDATFSYPPSRVKSITRQFVYLRPDTFVIFDRVEAEKEDLETIWNLHSLTRPAWVGRTAEDASLPAAEQWIVKDDLAKKEPNPEPGGRFLHDGGDVFVITDTLGAPLRPDGMAAGRLFVKLVLPGPEDRIVRTIGGRWHDFEINGINYLPFKDAYTRNEGHRGRANYLQSVGIEGWRIELSPKKQTFSTRFLVAMHVGDEGVKTMPDTEPVREEGRVGTRLNVGDRIITVMFNAEGAVGGHVRITEHGKVLVDRELVTQVEDNLQRWSTDPRFEKWMTHPALENLIGKEDRASYRRKVSAR